LFGLDSFNASLPLSNHGFDPIAGAGVLSTPSDTKVGGPLSQLLPQDEVDPFTGKGYLLEADDATVFKTVDALVKRQEPLAKNRLAQDRHWTATKGGYTFSSLTKQDNQDIYTQTWPAGYASGLRIGAVPNKQADLCQKLVETLLVDPPKLDPEATTDDEAAQRGAELAREFLTQDATEAGTDDLTLFASQTERATTRASVFNHYWVDPTGGGSIPKQIKAHPMATDPANPLDAVNPMTGQPEPTTDYVLRYVTAGTDEAPAQFTEHPAEAEKVWLPKIRVDQMGREHVRLFPESANLQNAQKVVCLWYATVEECRRRWPEHFDGLSDAELTAYCAWTPQRPAALLPSALRARWRTGKADQSSDSTQWTADERLVFFYLYYCVSEPGYPEGCAIVVNGANNGTVFHKDTLSATVEVPSGTRQDAVVTDTKPMDLPLAQLMLLPDAEDGDPMGKAFMSRIGGPGEAAATMATAMMEAIDITLHPARFATATSPLTNDDVEASRATGDFATVLTKDDYPDYEKPRELPGAFFPYMQWLQDGMDSSAGLRPPDRANEAKVKSGVALRIEVAEATKTLTRMNHALHTCWTRHGRIKLQLAMKHFSVPQLLRYTGNDGVANQEWFSGNDFARVGNIAVMSGTGTMMPPIERVNFVLQLAQAGLMDRDTALEVAVPAYRRTIGAPDDPHLQRVERQISSFLEGMPEGYEAQAAQYAEAVQAHAMQAQAVLAVDPTAMIPPEPEAPWTPFATLPMDVKPAIAAMRERRLAALMAKVEFSEQPKVWQEVAKQAYAVAAQAMQAGQMAAQMAAMPQTPPAGQVVAGPNAGNPEAQEAQATPALMVA
jgi:hypothetical protein